MVAFILGAGFNVDASGEAGPQFATGLHRGQYRVEDCSYPMLSDLACLVSQSETIPEDLSIEERFSKLLEAGEVHLLEPLRKLAERLNCADYRFARCLADDQNSNCYAEFFRTFTCATFLTFNYDSLPETILFRLGHWDPRIGYGVPVAAHLAPLSEDPFDARTSITLVLHLHGSLCVTTSHSKPIRPSGTAIDYLELREQPLFRFDPYSISSNFYPFERIVGDYKLGLPNRIIAPIRKKTEGLKREFIDRTYEKARAVLQNARTVVAIGYRFSAHDWESFAPLLEELSVEPGRQLLIVSPEADATAQSVRTSFPRLSVKACKMTFRKWVKSSFKGL